MKSRATKQARDPQNAPQQSAGVSGAVAENRREPRYAASGRVSVRFQSITIEGQLVDVSASGFRMEHSSNLLESGQKVEFEHPQAIGTATVVWNRILNGQVQTGFFIANP